MSGDRELANLLGERPEGPGPGFRIDVFARIAARAKRRAAARRAFAYAAGFTLAGLSVPVARAVGLTSAELMPLLLVAGALALAYVLAVAAMDGPRAVLARSRALLRAHP